MRSRAMNHLTAEPAPSATVSTEPTWCSDFLSSLKKGDTLEDACAKVGISPGTAHLHRRKNEEFAKRWVQAVQSAAEWKDEGQNPVSTECADAMEDAIAISLDDACRLLQREVHTVQRLARQKGE